MSDHARFAAAGTADDRYALSPQRCLTKRSLDRPFGSELIEGNVVDRQVFAPRGGIEGVSPLKMDQDVVAHR